MQTAKARSSGSRHMSGVYGLLVTARWVIGYTVNVLVLHGVAPASTTRYLGAECIGARTIEWRPRYPSPWAMNTGCVTLDRAIRTPIPCSMGCMHAVQSHQHVVRRYCAKQVLVHGTVSVTTAV